MRNLGLVLLLMCALFCEGTNQQADAAQPKPQKRYRFQRVGGFPFQYPEGHRRVAPCWILRDSVTGIDYLFIEDSRNPHQPGPAMCRLWRE